MYAQSLECIRGGLDRLQAVAASTTPEAACCWTGIAHVQLAQGMKILAHESFQEAIRIHEQIGTPMHPDCVRCREQLASLEASPADEPNAKPALDAPADR